MRAPEMVHAETDGCEPMATPRTWEYTSWVMNLMLPTDLQALMIQGLIGPGPFAQFSVFLQDAAVLPTPKEILSGKVPVEIRKNAKGTRATLVGGTEVNAGQLYALACGIASAAESQDDIEAVFDVVERFHSAEHQVLCVKELFARKRQIGKMKQFAKWAGQFREKLAR